MRYDGGKGVCYPHLINLIPPHKRYIETHLGGGAVMRNKKPSKKQIGIELDPAVIQYWENHFPDTCDLIHGDAVSVLHQMDLDDDTVVYSDPPYHPDTRLRQKVYKHDYSIDDHIQLLKCLCNLPCRVLISGYPSELYADHLDGWNIYKFNAKTHSGVREEWVWYNYERPKDLHDYRFVGENFRQRELIKRRQERLRNRIESLSSIEQSILFQWMKEKITTEELI